jgi:CheY-like chemotaxis protein
MPHRRARDVLIVDDDPGIRMMLAAGLARLGLSTDAAADGVAALECVESSSYEVLLVDLTMPRLGGAAFIARLIDLERASSTRPTVLVMTASTDFGALAPVRHRVREVIDKPFDILTVGKLIRDCARASLERAMERDGGDVPKAPKQSSP